MASNQRLVHGLSDFSSPNAEEVTKISAAYRVIIRIWGYAWNMDNDRLKGVAYLSAMHMAVSIEGINVAITFEQSHFCEIHESKTFQTSSLFC